MKIEIINHYGTNDPRFMKDSVTDLIVNGVFIYKGEDQYHHEINSKIEGFLDCLKYLSNVFEMETITVADCEYLND